MALQSHGLEDDHESRLGWEGRKQMLKRLIEQTRAALQAPTAKPSALSEKSLRASDKKIVQRLATGSVRLQRGEYSTAEDIDRQRVKPNDDA